MLTNLHQLRFLICHCRSLITKDHQLLFGGGPSLIKTEPRLHISDDRNFTFPGRKKTDYRGIFCR